MVHGLISRKKEGAQIHFWITKETRDRLEQILKCVPYSISIASIGEHGLNLALDELETAFPIVRTTK